MILAGDDAIFIVGAYGAVIVGVVGLIGWTALSNRQVKRRLAALDARGLRRRSDTQP